MTRIVAGVDEVGRGPLAGAVVSAAVILPDNHGILGLADSKKLTEARRERLFAELVDSGAIISLGRAEVEEIDRLNILNATMLSMQRAVRGLKIQPDFCLIDGNRVPELDCEAEAIVKGDQKIEAISAASIIAKVSRDREMKALHLEFPEYGFDRHKGYPTQLHRNRLAMYGPTPQHRMSFAPVAAAALQSKS